jgi:hypothetical protein
MSGCCCLSKRMMNEFPFPSSVLLSPSPYIYIYIYMASKSELRETIGVGVANMSTTRLLLYYGNPFLLWNPFLFFFFFSLCMTDGIT